VTLLIFFFIVIAWIGSAWLAYLVGRSDGVELQKRRSYRAWNRAEQQGERTW
jgi:hypothetical protein